MSKSLKQDIDKFDELANTMQQAKKKRTLEEQVAYLKSQGIDPAKTYANWDDDQEDLSQITAKP